MKQWTGVLAWVGVSLVASAILLVAGDESPEPDLVRVQHILIGFKRSVPGKSLQRTRAEAREIAEGLVVRARDGEDFDALVKEYTDDRHPGIYLLTNRGAPRVGGSRTRDDMVPRFGDVAFRLAVGEIGLAEYHGGLSPYGWHVIKRIE